MGLDYPDALGEPRVANPYLLPADRHGWRGLGLPGHRKRKWYTLIHNEQVLVTALLLIPDERSVRHSHETGELSIHYDGAMQPVVTWHPPGMLHPTDEALRAPAHGPPPPLVPSREPRRPGSTATGGVGLPLPASEANAPEASHSVGPGGGIDAAGPDLQQLLQKLVAEQVDLRRTIERLTRGQPAPRIIVDVLFPPFKTTIDDPAYPDRRTIVGQWYD